MPTGSDNPLRTTDTSPTAPGDAADFQGRVRQWVEACFGDVIADDRDERNHRFLEESLELVQSLGCRAEDAHALVDYVFGREPGHVEQEVGGVAVTFDALCSAHRMDRNALAERELSRVWDRIDAIREKQKAKPAIGPLPGVYPDRPLMESASNEASGTAGVSEPSGTQEMENDIGSVIRAMAARGEAELQELAQTELEQYWHFRWDDERSLERNIYVFQDMLKLYGGFCRRWEEKHNGTTCVVERVRDTYLMPKIREFAQQLRQRAIAPSDSSGHEGTSP